MAEKNIEQKPKEEVIEIKKIFENIKKKIVNYALGKNQSFDLIISLLCSEGPKTKRGFPHQQ